MRLVSALMARLVVMTLGRYDATKVMTTMRGTHAGRRMRQTSAAG